MSKLRGQYNDRCLGGSLEDLDPLVILAFDHNAMVSEIAGQKNSKVL